MWIIFPNQAFSKDILETIPNWKKETYLLWEEPLFYGIRPDSKAYKGTLKLNKLRIIYQKWVWNNYISYLQSLNLKTKVISYEDLIDKKRSHIVEVLKNIAGSETLECFDPEDEVLKNRCKSLSIKWHTSPMFLVTHEHLQTYISSISSKQQYPKLQHRHFYNFVKTKVLPSYISLKNPIPESKDMENRKPIPKGFELPSLPYSEISKDTMPMSLTEAVSWCNNHFKNYPGPSDLKKSVQSYLVHIPSTSAEAELWWNNYRKSRFQLFGPYEDAIITAQPILFHSFSAMLLNIGLLTPKFIIQDLFHHYSFDKSSKYKEIEASLEGFLRQIAGWREYSRLYYRMIPSSIYKLNPFEQKGKLNKEWYTSSISNSMHPPIVEEAIRDAWNMGYLHHIRRLMVISNYMNLQGINPEQVYKWMYEFSLDSWEWVMVFNVYSMGTWSDKGHAMRKPYISSPNYLLKMSDTSKGPWVEKWTKLYKEFLKKQTPILKHTVYAYQL